MITRPRFYAVTVLAFAGLAAAGCSSSSSSGLPTSVMDVAAKIDATTPTPITSGTVSSSDLVNQFFAAGLIPTKVDISSYITNEFNDTVSGSP